MFKFKEVLERSIGWYFVCEEHYNKYLENNSNEYVKYIRNNCKVSVLSLVAFIESNNMPQYAKLIIDKFSKVINDEEYPLDMYNELWNYYGAFGGFDEEQEESK